MTIFFDMDGTIANLYSVPEWLPKLRKMDESPYLDAKPLVNMSLLARLLHQVQTQGYEIGIISYGSKVSDNEYLARVARAKASWLHKHLPSVRFDKVVVCHYGTPKSTFMDTESDVLFDDEQGNLTEWTGASFTPDLIIEILKDLCAGG